MANLNNLQNISNINLNTSVLTGDELINDSMNIFITAVPYWLFPVTIIFFIMLTWFVQKKLDWGLDFIQAATFSAFIQIVLSYAIIKAGWSVSVVPLTFWGFIWIIGVISIYSIRKRG